MSTVQQTNSHIFTNRNGNTLMKEFEGVLQHNPQIQNLDAVVGFLRASGYFSLRPFLDSLNKVRVLIGIDVDKYIAEAARQGKLFLGAEDNVKQECLHLTRKDIESSSYSKEIEDGMFQMVQDLLDGKLELRAHPSKKIHAKIYVLYPDDFNQYTQGMAITGSSNLSGNGLGITEERQYEFNVKMTQHEDVQFAKDEFESLWEEAKNCEIAADDIKMSIDRTYLKGDVSPYDLYIKMLMEYFSDRILETDNEAPFDMPEGYTKYDYQMDAVIEGYQKLIRYDGFFLADVVGLGKTVIATMIAKKFLIENGRDNTKILVVYPPAVEQNWKTTFKDFGIDKYANFISNGSLSKVLDEDNYNYWNADEYDLILVDEAHKFRSHTTSAFEYLQEICKMPRIETGNIPGYKKKVMLISATPMNNTPADLYNQILLFQDARHCTIDGVSNLTAFFSPLIVEFKKLRNNPESDMSDFKRLAEKVRDRVIKPLTVRRTRTDIESVSRYNKDVNGFPKVERPVESRYELNEHLANLFEQAMHTLDKDLSYARYQAIAYLKPEVSNGLYDNAELISRNLAGIRKNGLVKRLESSFFAFQVSINNFRQANQNMLDMFTNNKIFIAPDLDVNTMMATMTEEEIEERLNQKAKDNPKNAVFKADDFQPEFIEMLEVDQTILEKMCSDWQGISDDDDSKFAKFKELLKHELFKVDRNPEQKLVVFSESVDTVNYLQRRINRPDVLVISSDNRSQQFKIIRENFDANYKTKLNNYNIILTTDVLAEGVNLHRSNVIVNYDTPWNSTRLMQRIGRVNRIGSVSKHIYNYVFYPSREGNREINLNQIAISKIQTFHSTFGEDNQIYSQHEILDRNLSKLFDEALKEQKKDINQEIPYYEELRSFYQTNRREYNRIAKLSLRSRTGREPRVVDGVTLSDDTLVFLKTNFRKVFFLVSENAEEISVIEALKYFKASPDEKPVERITQHHQHVEKALMEFHTIRETEILSQETSKEEQSNMGAQVSTAINLLTSFMREIDDSDLYLKVAQLKSLAERGVITYIAKRLQRIQKDLRRIGGKSRMTHDEALHEIIEIAKKYAPYYMAEEALLNEKETDAEIILSESFR
ncbi:SNF2/RAD54 family helicase [Porphyromonas macacae]|uniref:SNF2/RAD54 family helicase n=1 Tax=Porphyromonas macacae TaxID=28115 RepID=A0A0A2ED15_9PORP|nr:helicase-related protein [Porphyromonas macacae]KGN74324.1 SNF2/RAD54 family helicase [Porphyromonas macacae]KGN99389.1 SNF2/RAD54 family helicase [Porphyromonas macacae]